MTMNWRQRLEKLEHEGEAWFQERARQVAVARDELEHAGARAYELASRTGRDVLARTPDEVRQLGQAVVQAATEKRTTPVRPVSQPAKAKTRSVLSTAREAALQVDTVMRSAANTITLGGADRLAAGIDAALASGKGGKFEDRYKQGLAEYDARNRYDAEHRPLAQGIGNVLGGGLAIAAIGPMEGLLAAAPRMIGAAKLTGREGLALVTGGAGVGAGIQTVGDVATGRRSTAGDIAGAAVGGAIDAAVLPFVGPARAAAVGSAATSAAQDTLNGREVSSARASRAAILGNVAGGVGGIGGRVGSNGLSPKAKGELGEAIGAMRSQIDGLRREVKGKARDYLPGGVYWYPDAVSGDMRFEDKFGVAAKLSKNQEKARAFLGEKFRLYHTVPADIGKVVGGIVGLAPSYHREDRTRSTR